MRYGSVCSGIEAATAAWHPLGWKPAFFSEIEKFPRAVLEHHYPGVPLHGDFTTIEKNEYGSIDLLVGGTPCQSFSIAGLRGGMVDERGNLALEYLRLAQRKRPQWLVWENVPGVLSSSEGRDFGAFLGGLGELGYGFAYRVLDAQFFGVPQRRRRVFVVGYLGDWRPAAAVLFERQSLQGHSAPRREKGQDIAGTLEAGIGRRRGNGMNPSQLTTHRMRGFGDYELDEVASTVKSRDAKDATDLVCVHGTQDPIISKTTAHSLGRNQGQENAIAFAQNSRNELRLEGGDGSVAGALSTGGGKPGQGVPMVFKPSHFTRGKDGAPSEVVPPLTADADKGDQEAVVLAESVSIRGRDGGATAELSGQTATALRASQGGGDKAHVLTQMAVRRLTPRECERLQGFPDDYTLIDYSKRASPEKIDADVRKYFERTGYTGERLFRASMCPDGPRYKALGNSMAVPVMHWIGTRIDQVAEILRSNAL